ncbi:hypothetical protein J2W46_006283 [Paraburkholderia strydomiana]|nr:hypothetical protein [Paraburkholderia strydomiana]
MHLIRNSLNLASWKYRKLLAAAINPIYQAQAAAAALDAFAQSEWGRKLPIVAAMWHRQGEQVILFFAYNPRYVELYTRQRNREHAHAVAQDRQEPRPLSGWRSGQQTAVPGLAQHRKGLEDATYHLTASNQSIRQCVRRAIYRRPQLSFSTDLSTQSF